MHSSFVMRKIGATSLFYLLFLCTAHSQNSSGYHVVKTFHIASEGWWDYLAVYEDKLYVSHGAQVNILNKNNGDSIGVIKNTEGVHGIAFIKNLNRGYTSNGRTNNVTVFDLKTNKTLRQIATGENPDAIMYDNFSKKIYTCNGRSKDISVIDPATDKVIKTIALGGKPETAVSDEAGRLYINIEDKNKIAEVNTNTYIIEKRWSIAPAEGPTGLAYDKKTKRLFAGCEKLLVVSDASAGKVISKLPIGDGCDGVAFDPATKNIFTSNGGEGTVTVIHENGANSYKILGNHITKQGARTIALDEQTHRLYLPTAEFEPLAKNAPKNERPKMIPGSFQVLVVEK
jgi:YVTN family beta-propeller protein